MANPTTLSWVDPTLNEDGTALAAGEVTGYLVSARLASGPEGTYTSTFTAAATDLSCPIASLSPALGYGTFAFTVQAITANGNGAPAAEDQFTLAAPVPAAPTGLKAG